MGKAVKNTQAKKRFKKNSFHTTHLSSTFTLWMAEEENHLTAAILSALEVIRKDWKAVTKRADDILFVLHSIKPLRLVFIHRKAYWVKDM